MSRSVDDGHELSEAELEAREAARMSKISNFNRAPVGKNLKALLNPDLKKIRKQPDVNLKAEPVEAKPVHVEESVSHSTAPAPAKQEAPKQEVPKQEAPKQEAPKQETPKQEPPKQEVLKQEASKQEAVKPAEESKPSQCPYCGHAAGPGAFCGGCGSKIVGPSVPPPNTNVAPKAASPVEKRTKEAWEKAPSQAQFNTRFEQTLLAEIVLARQNPGAIVEKLQERKRFYKGNEYHNEATGTHLMTQEGVAAVDEALDYCINRLKGLGDKARLKPYDGLHQSVRDYCQGMVSSEQPNETQDDAQKRLTRYGKIQGNAAQCVALADLHADEILLDWVIDDGQPARPNRQTIFNGDFQAIGIASGPHSKAGRITAAVFAHSYIPQTELEAYKAVGEQPPAEFTGSASKPAAAESAGSSAPSQPGRTFPAYQVGDLQPVDKLEGSAPYTSANLLPITQLGCNKSDMALRLLQNGNYLEFSRSNGETREVQGFNLPYQVLQSTVSAKYEQNENNGTLYIRLGKPNVAVSIQGEYEITKFTVSANPSSNVSRVTVQVDQTPEVYKFFPGPATKFDVDFTVVLVGAVLEFRSVFSEPDGNVVKTIHGKQSVQLPVPPSREQISVDGKTIIVKAKSSTPAANQPDVDITIA